MLTHTIVWKQCWASDIFVHLSLSQTYTEKESNEIEWCTLFNNLNVLFYELNKNKQPCTIFLSGTLLFLFLSFSPVRFLWYITPLKVFYWLILLDCVTKCVCMCVYMWITLSKPSPFDVKYLSAFSLAYTKCTAFWRKTCLLLNKKCGHKNSFGSKRVRLLLLNIRSQFWYQLNCEMTLVWPSIECTYIQYT